MMNIQRHSSLVINTVREKTDRVILFYSCGKDSIAMLDMVAPSFREVVCVYMYFVKGLHHIDRFIKYSKAKYTNVTFLEIPHWNLSRALKIGFFCQPQKDIKLMKLRDVIDRVRIKTGIEWCFLGMKQADSLNRRLMLRTYKHEAINMNSKIAYPLSLWKKKEVIAYIRFHNLPTPVEYSKEAGNGLWFDLKVYLWLKANAPGDLEKILTAFPLSEKYYLIMSKELSKYFKSEPIEIKRTSISFANYNPRKISEDALKKLKQNIRRVGLLGGIIWNKRTGNIVSGHQRITVLDRLNGYDGTKDTDYVLRVEQVNLSDKEEKEQNIFMNNQSVQGEFDLDVLRDLIPDIDYKSAGLTEQDLSVIGFDFEMPVVEDIASDFVDLSNPYDMKKAEEKKTGEMSREARIAHNKEVKAKVMADSSKQVEGMEAYVMLSFDTYAAKVSFMKRFGYDPGLKFIKGEVFSDQVERID